MLKLISYPVSAIYYAVFGLFLVIFHPVQWLCFNVFGYQAHKKSVDWLNGCLVASTFLLGTRYKINGRKNIPNGVPLILVSNHQSLYDIPMIIWFLRKTHPKFVSKIELAKGIPSVSYNLRHGGSVLIDRKDPKQALVEIKKLGQYIEQNNRAAVIFPEGTRSKDGAPLSFAESGLKMLCKFAPNAYIVPLTINNSWKMVKYGSFPLTLGNKLSLNVHNPIQVKDASFEELFSSTHNAVISKIKY